MAKPSARQINIPQWNFSCTGCGECCRRWHVALSVDEVKRLQGFQWSEHDAIPNEVTTTIKGHEYITHTNEGCCVFLDTTTNRCKIHERFGMNAKPKGCRVYPFNIATTFPKSYSAIARFDCPAVRQNYGEPLDRSLNDIRGFIEEMKLKGGFDRYVLDGITKKEIEIFIPALCHRLIEPNELSTQHKLESALISTVRLEKLGADFIKHIDVDDILPSFFDRSISNTAELKPKAIPLPERWRFLNVFISYLRRDEEVIERGWSRITRLGTFWNIIFRKGNLRNIGKEHPNALVDGKRLFQMPVANADEIDWALYLNLIRLRLQSYQFFGPTYYNLSFFIGLKSLFFSFPLVIAAAKWSALARYSEQCFILPEDVDYAVGVIDHSLGRSALLGTGLFTTLVRQMTDIDAYSRLVHALLKGQRFK